MRWGQLGNPSSHWTTGLSRHWLQLAIAGITVLHFWLSTHIPPAEDELYYWAWAQNLQLSYFDHPPMVAYLIRVSTSIFGDGLFVIRFFAVIFGTVILLLLAQLSSGRELVLMLCLTPISLVGSVIMTPDIPLLFFWTLYLLWSIGANQKFSNWSDDPVARVYRPSPVGVLEWAVGGVILGLGILSKYTMGLAVACSLAVFFSRYRFRSWARGYAIHLFVAFLCALPILVFNARHGFIPLKFQWNHSLGGFHLSLATFFDFIGSQLLLVGAIPLLVLPWVLIRMRELQSDQRMRVCFFFFCVPFLFFLAQAMRSKLEANWALVTYIALFPLAQRLLDHSSFRYVFKTIVAITFLLPIAVSALVLFHLVSPLKFVPATKDRIGRLKANFELSRQVARELPAITKASVLFLPTYQWTSYFKFQGITSEQLHPFGRQSQFTLSPSDICQQSEALAFVSSKSDLGPLSCFPHHKLIREYPLFVRGEPIDQYVLIHYSR